MSARQIAPTATLYGQHGGADARYQLVHSLNGESAMKGLAVSHIAGRDVVPAQYDGIPFEGDDPWPHCKANNSTCKAPRVKGFDFCVGHKRAAEKAEAQVEPS